MPRLPISIIIFFILLTGCDNSQLQAPNPPAVVREVPADWAIAQKERRIAKAEHIRKFKDSYDQFANFAVSETDGVPYIMLKLLPIIAPEYWGSGDKFLDVIGLYIDDRQLDYPMPRGIGFSGLSRKELHGNIDYASFTCGGCHIGRVRLDDGSIEYLDGGINTEFNVILFRHKVNQTLQKIYAGETDAEKKNQRVIDAILVALKNSHKQDKHFFYKNYRYKTRHFDAQYEQKQIELFTKNASTFIPKYVKTIEAVYRGWGILADKLYPDIKPDIMLGFAGMEDAISFNAVSAYNGLKPKFIIGWFAAVALPSHPGITDIMAVWDQDSRNPRWNEARDDLINGGGQWNGHIPMPIFKNIAAQKTLGFDNVDIRVSDHSNRLLDKLPPSVYPFEVDVALARKGQALFAANCASCHQPNNGKVYRNMGTHLGRAKIANQLITIAAQSSFTAACSPTTVTVDIDGTSRKPCAEYRGVSLVGKKKLAMTSPSRHDGYNALPLVGLWAQAPYLHNGSIPTIYHLLMPAERPASFSKSRLDYDKKWLGFSWDPGVSHRGGSKEGYIYKPASSPSIGNAGHNKDILQGDKTYGSSGKSVGK